MPRKHNLSELIETEAEKFTPTGSDTTIEIKAEAIVEETPTSPEESSQPTPEVNAAAKRNSPTKADLEVTIKELQANLTQSAAEEKSLQQKISSLQSALSEQKVSVEKLTKELEETKKTALQLAEANSQLIEENKSLVQAKLIEENKALVHTQQQQEQQKLVPQKPEKEAYNPMNYRKSHRLPQSLPPIQQPNETKDDFASNTWLYD